jgi:hypothetical protein
MDINNLDKPISVDIDIDRIRASVGECLFMINEYFGSQKTISVEKALESLNKILDSGKISVEFFIPLPNSKIPDLILRVDPRRKKLLLKSKYKKKVANLNYFVRVL